MRPKYLMNCFWNLFCRLEGRLIVHALAAFLTCALPGFLQAGVSPVKVVFLGDSITKGERPGGTVKAEQTFVSLVEKEMESAGFSVQFINSGIPDIWTGPILENKERKLTENVIAWKPQITVVMLGTNDAFVDKGNSPVPRCPSVEQYKINMRRIIKEIQNSGSIVVLMTPPMQDSAFVKVYAWAPYSDTHDANCLLNRYVEACRQVANELGLSLVDNYAKWGDAKSKGQDLALWLLDGCLPNPIGHKLIQMPFFPF